MEPHELVAQWQGMFCGLGSSAVLCPCLTFRQRTLLKLELIGACVANAAARPLSNFKMFRSWASGRLEDSSRFLLSSVLIRTSRSLM